MFTIVSITPENGKNICRKYTAEVSSSNEGKLILMSEGETDKPVGTEIIISCKDGDLQVGDLIPKDINIEYLNNGDYKDCDLIDLCSNPYGTVIVSGSIT